MSPEVDRVARVMEGPHAVVEPFLAGGVLQSVSRRGKIAKHLFDVRQYHGHLRVEVQILALHRHSVPPSARRGLGRPGRFPVRSHAGKAPPGGKAWSYGVEPVSSRTSTIVDRIILAFITSKGSSSDPIQRP